MFKNMGELIIGYSFNFSMSYRSYCGKIPGLTMFECILKAMLGSGVAGGISPERITTPPYICDLFIWLSPSMPPIPHAGSYLILHTGCISGIP